MPVITLETESVAVIDWSLGGLEGHVVECVRSGVAGEEGVAARETRDLNVRAAQVDRSDVMRRAVFDVAVDGLASVTVTVPEVPATSGLAKVVETTKS